MDSLIKNAKSSSKAVFNAVETERALPLRISGIGTFLPPRVETSDDLAVKIKRSPKWIYSRAGVERRHISDISVPELGAKAATIALSTTGRPDLLINASATPHQILPDTSVFIAKELGFEGIPTFSVHASCLSFFVALQVAASFLHSAAFHRILVVSAEAPSIARNMKEPESAAILGDGAAAVVLESSPISSGPALLSWRMGTWPSGSALAELKGGGLRAHPNDAAFSHEDNLFHMDGPAIYRTALRVVPEILQLALGAAGLTVDEIDLVVPHQASGLAVNGAAKHLGVPSEKVVNVIAGQGNCVAASMPLALSAALADGRAKPGSLLLLVGTGAGLSAGAAVLRI